MLYIYIHIYIHVYIHIHLNVSLYLYTCMVQQMEMLGYLLETLGDQMFESKDRNGANLAHWAGECVARKYTETIFVYVCSMYLLVIVLLEDIQKIHMCICGYVCM